MLSVRTENEVQANLKTDSRTQSTEPIRFPKIQMHVAPFPYLQFSGPAANLGNLMRSSVRLRVQINLSTGFTKAVGIEEFGCLE